MSKPSNFTKIAAAVSLLAGSQAALALTPWANGAPFITIYTSGGSAQDKAVSTAVSSVLSVSGTLDTFQDTVVSSQRQNGVTVNITTNGGNFTAYYFTGSSSLTDTSLRGQKILLVKRSLGSSSYDVVPLIQNTAIDNLNITNTVASNWSGSGTTHLATINNGNASTYLTQVASQGGLIGVDAPSLLQPGTYNYPVPTTEVSTNALTSPWATNLTAASLTNAKITREPTGGETYGIAVTADLYQVLQAAQVADGTLTLPSGHTYGSYSADGDLPNLSRNFVAALLAGNVQTWANVEVNDKINGATPLTSYATVAGVTAPGNNVIGVGIRNAGATIGAVSYAKFLNYPFAANATTPPTLTPNDATDEYNALPIIKTPVGTTDTDNLLNDWQYGDNVTGYNNVPAATAGDNTSTYTYEHIWGLAVQTADRNNTATLGYRYIKIDGAAPTVANVANGSYPIWAEGEVLISPNASSSASLFLKDFAQALGSVPVAKAVNNTLIQPYGQASIFATPVTANQSNNTAPAVSNQIPYNNSYPYVPFTTVVSGNNTSLYVQPHALDNTVSTNPTIQLK